MKTEKGEEQYWNKETSTMMLESDLSLIKDEKFLAIVKEYAGNTELWFKDFSSAWVRL